MSSPFSAQVRVLACDQCGAPVDAPPAGGTSRCRFCSAQLVWAPRDLGVTSSVAHDEAGRALRLWQQTNIPPTESTIVSQLIGAAVSARVPDARLGEAFALWQSLVARARQGDPSVDLDLTQLAIALCGQPKVQADAHRMRAMLETTLEVVRAPAHHAEILGLLARAACREGDAAGAEGWLRALDPCSEDLTADSEYRISHAVFFTVKGDPMRVLALLGSEPNEVPIHSPRVPVASVFRANAHARMGDAARAHAQLAVLHAQSGDFAQAVAQNYPRLGLVVR